jgi:hypothetical protein
MAQFKQKIREVHVWSGALLDWLGPSRARFSERARDLYWSAINEYGNDVTIESVCARASEELRGFCVSNNLGVSFS